MTVSWFLGLTEMSITTTFDGIPLGVISTGAAVVELAGSLNRNILPLAVPIYNILFAV
jgi:hypothetical protein